MKAGGFIKQSLIDYPGNIASVMFTIGCNFNCGYCHNPELVLADLVKKTYVIPELEILNYLSKYNHLLDALVITGGEPTLQTDLIGFVEKVKQLGLKVKLDTNGTQPEILKQLIEEKLIDYIAMDLKAPLTTKQYQRIVGSQFSDDNMQRVKDSIDIILNSSIEHEFRTTIAKNLLSNEDIKNMAMAIKTTKKYALQTFVNSKHILPEAQDYEAYSKTETEQIIKSLCLTKNQLEVR